MPGDENYVFYDNLADEMYDLCVVGAGMIGSAAARHASRATGTELRVCLVGAPEPQESERQRASVLGSHYDEGRITRRVDVDPFNMLVATRSIDRYRDLERQTGISFYQECGCVTVAPKHKSDMFISSPQLTSNDVMQIDSTLMMDTAHARARLPWIVVHEEQVAILETKNAGVINPRKLVAAQKAAAKQQGCDIFEDIVNRVTHKTECYVLTCESGRAIRTKKVLLCTGAFTTCRRLLPSNTRPDLSYISQTVMLVEIPASKMEDFEGMPAVLYRFPLKDDQSIPDRCYVLPPLQFPDGRYYMKIGHGDQFERPLMTGEEVMEWMRSQPPSDDQSGMLRLFQKVLPDVATTKIKYETCVISRTHNKRPFIDIIDRNFGVALGGNGYAAKSSDEIGRLGAELVLRDVWDCPFRREEFEMKFTSVPSNL